MTLTCPRCAASFTPRTRTQRFCSVPCGRRQRAADWKDKQRADPDTAKVYRAAVAKAARTLRQIKVYGFPTSDPLMMTKDRFAQARALGYRSGLEVKVAKSLEERGIDFDYEQHTIRYEVPARTARSTPDFVLPNGIVVETKGLWDSDDRKKIALIRSQYPDLDFRMVFTNPNAKITKGSKTSYADICIKLGIPFATKDIPTAWLNEPRNEKSVAILESLT